MIFLSTADEEVRSVKVQKQIPGFMEHKHEAGVVFCIVLTHPVSLLLGMSSLRMHNTLVQDFLASASSRRFLTPCEICPPHSLLDAV